MLFFKKSQADKTHQPVLIIQITFIYIKKKKEKKQINKLYKFINILFYSCLL